MVAVATQRADPAAPSRPRARAALGLFSAAEGMGVIYLSIALALGLKPATLLDYGYYSPKGKPIIAGVAILGLATGVALIIAAVGTLRGRRWGMSVGLAANLCLLVLAVGNIVAGDPRCPWLIRSAWIEACDSFAHVFPKSLIVYALLFLAPPGIYIALWAVARAKDRALHPVEGPPIGEA